MITKIYKEHIDIKQYKRKAVYHSELCLFYEYAQKFNIKRVVESGTYRGFTANRLAKLFPNCQIGTYETNKSHWEKAVKKCDKRIKVINGSLNEDILNEHTAVLIDGPKGKKAIELAQQIIDKVAFVAIHDMKDYIPTLKKIFGEVVHSGKPDKAFKKLDKYIPYKSSHHGKYYGQVLACVKSL